MKNSVRKALVTTLLTGIVAAGLFQTQLLAAPQPSQSNGTEEKSSAQTKSDGTKTYKDSDGATVQIHSDGSKTIKKPNGTVIQIQPDGTKKIQKADGTTIQVNPDGSKTIKKPDGTTIEVKGGEDDDKSEQ
jgi:hypothetical protein